MHSPEKPASHPAQASRTQIQNNVKTILNNLVEMKVVLILL